MSPALPDWGFANELDDVAGAVAIAGVGEADHSKASGRSSEDIAVQAIERALADAGLEARDVDSIMFSPGVGDQLDADGLASGIYFVELRTAFGSAVRKAVLLK